MTTMNNETETDADTSGGAAADGFGRLYEQYLPGVYQYVIYRVGDKAVAEDLTSDIFSKALTNIKKYDSRKAAFSTWIFSIARNTVIDYYRARGREQKLQKKEAEANSTFVSPSTEEEASRSEEARKLHECLSLLSPNEQELISLKFSSEMTNREISKIMGLSESNVGTILWRAVRKLRDSFSEWRNEG